MIRAFLGLAVPAEVRGALQVQQFLLPLPRKVEPADLHVTLVFLGDCPESVLETVHQDMLGLRAPRFALSIQGLGLFGKARPHAAWAAVEPSPSLLHLQSKVATIARRAGCRIDSRNFVPHVTLGRFPALAPLDAARLERAVAMGMGFRAGPWEVGEVTLWQSRLTGKGPRYDVLASYPLS